MIMLYVLGIVVLGPEFTQHANSGFGPTILDTMRPIGVYAGQTDCEEDAKKINKTRTQLYAKCTAVLVQEAMISRPQ